MTSYGIAETGTGLIGQDTLVVLCNKIPQKVMNFDHILLGINHTNDFDHILGH